MVVSISNTFACYITLGRYFVYVIGQKQWDESDGSEEDTKW